MLFDDSPMESGKRRFRTTETGARGVRKAFAFLFRPFILDCLYQNGHSETLENIICFIYYQRLILLFLLFQGGYAQKKRI